MAALSLLLTATFRLIDPDTVSAGDTTAVRDSAAVRAAAAAHFSVADSAVQRRVTIRADTAWVLVSHDRISFTIILLRRTATGWRFERNFGYGIQ